MQLQVQQSLTQNFTLQVGEVTQTVSVSATATLLQTQNSSLGTVVPTETLAQTPVNNRNYLNLTAISANANVVSTTQGQAGAREGGARANETISVGGSRIMFNHYTLDGINNSDPDFNSYVVQPSIDAIQEMKVQTGVYPAQYGYNATQVNVVTKSGSNNYHGAGFYFLRNNYADALGYNYFYPTPQPAALPYKYNDYGFVLTGPISIPHVFNGKNRFFFMVNDEWYSRISLSNTGYTLPTQAVLGGDFSQYTTTATGSVVPIYDPATGNPNGTGRTQFPGNVIPASRIDPTSLKFIQLFYAPAQNNQFQNNYTFLTNRKGQSRRLQRARRLLLVIEVSSSASASAMAWKRTPPRYSRRRAGQPAAISSPATTSTWAPTPGPSLPRSSTWPRLAGLISIILSACSRRASMTPCPRSGFPAFNPGFLQPGVFPR